jgi:predicted anti-sigma-YlaC factor YlaD
LYTSLGWSLQMVSCKDVGARLSPFLQGEMPYPERISIHQHLANCAQCGCMVEQARDALDVSKSALAHATDPVADEVPENLVNAIWSACHPVG